MVEFDGMVVEADSLEAEVVEFDGVKKEVKVAELTAKVVLGEAVGVLLTMEELDVEVPEHEGRPASTQATYSRNCSHRAEIEENSAVPMKRLPIPSVTYSWTIASWAFKFPEKS